jgi:hypothetical protein
MPHGAMEVALARLSVLPCRLLLGHFSLRFRSPSVPFLSVESVTRYSGSMGWSERIDLLGIRTTLYLLPRIVTVSWFFACMVVSSGERVSSTIASAECPELTSVASTPARRSVARAIASSTVIPTDDGPRGRETQPVTSTVSNVSMVSLFLIIFWPNACLIIS